MQTYQKVPPFAESSPTSTWLLDVRFHDQGCPYERGKRTVFVLWVFTQTRQNQRRTNSQVWNNRENLTNSSMWCESLILTSRIFSCFCCIHRPRSNWTTEYTNCQMGASDIWFQSSTKIHEQRHIEKSFFFSVEEVQYNRDINCGPKNQTTRTAAQHILTVVGKIHTLFK